jgi:hypothetical protein
MQLNLHTRCGRQADHQRNAQALQEDLLAALPAQPGWYNQPFLFVNPSNRQLMRHV